MNDDLDKLRQALIDMLGGTDVEAMVDEYFAGRTLGQIGRSRGLSPSCVHKKVHRMRGVFLRYGILPRRWKRRTQQTVSIIVNDD